MPGLYEIFPSMSISVRVPGIPPESRGIIQLPTQLRRGRLDAADRLADGPAAAMTQGDRLRCGVVTEAPAPRSPGAHLRCERYEAVRPWPHSTASQELHSRYSLFTA